MPQPINAQQPARQPVLQAPAEPFGGPKAKPAPAPVSTLDTQMSAFRNRLGLFLKGDLPATGRFDNGIRVTVQPNGDWHVTGPKAPGTMIIDPKNDLMFLSRGGSGKPIPFNSMPREKAQAAIAVLIQAFEASKGMNFTRIPSAVPRRQAQRPVLPAELA